MSINTAHANNGVLIHAGETYVVGDFKMLLSNFVIHEIHCCDGMLTFDVLQGYFIAYDDDNVIKSKHPEYFHFQFTICCLVPGFSFSATMFSVNFRGRMAQCLRALRMVAST